MFFVIQTDIFYFFAAFRILFELLFTLLLKKILVLWINPTRVFVLLHVFLRLVKAHVIGRPEVVEDTLRLEINSNHLL